MTKEEAVVQMELLKIQSSRIQEEISRLKKQFCYAGNHYFRRLWAPCSGSGLFKVIGWSCMLCDLERIVDDIPGNCPICKGVIDNGHADVEDLATCAYCGFNNLQSPEGVSFDRIPRGDKIQAS